MPRVVLLGASNLVLSLPLIVCRLAAGLPRPLDLYIACGHGRSYCGWSRAAFRGLPGIGDCGLWNDLNAASIGDLETEPPTPTLALLTDVGNDLIYGASPALIADCVHACVDRLAHHGAEMVITRLPVASIERLSALRFHATKAVFFPRTGGVWPAMRASTRELDARLQQMSEQTGVRVCEQPGEWYGFDPIHIRRRLRDRAWTSLFQNWSLFHDAGRTPRLPWKQHLRVRLAAPAERSLFGRRSKRRQPAFAHDDVRVHLY